MVVVSWVASHAGDDPKPSGTGSLASSPEESRVELDVSPVVTPAEVEQCLTRRFATDVADVEVLYSAVQKSEKGDVPVLVLRNQLGELRLCDSFGGDAPSVVPVQLADDATPVQYLSNGRQSWDCDGTRLSAFAISHWLSVGNVVDRVDLRFIIDGATRPWFSAAADQGFAHVHGWLSEQNDGATVAVQVRVLSSDGEVVPQETIPTEPQSITGCNGGDIDLG